MCYDLETMIDVLFAMFNHFVARTKSSYKINWVERFFFKFSLLNIFLLAFLILKCIFYITFDSPMHFLKCV